MSDLKDSSSIEYDADVVVLLYRPEYYGFTEDTEGNPIQNMAEVIVAKNRNGREGSVWLKFISKYIKFENAEDSDFENYKNENNFDDQPNMVILRSRMDNSFSPDYGNEPPF